MNRPFHSAAKRYEIPKSKQHRFTVVKHAENDHVESGSHDSHILPTIVENDALITDRQTVGRKYLAKQRRFMRVRRADKNDMKKWTVLWPFSTTVSRKCVTFPTNLVIGRKKSFNLKIGKKWSVGKTHFFEV